MWPRMTLNFLILLPVLTGVYRHTQFYEVLVFKPRASYMLGEHLPDVGELHSNPIAEPSLFFCNISNVNGCFAFMCTM
jgi:hypothetical protein